MADGVGKRDENGGDRDLYSARDRGQGGRWDRAILAAQAPRPAPPLTMAQPREAAVAPCP